MEVHLKSAFPDGFLWGAGTSAHQVEGNNINSDSWVMEHLPNSVFSEPSLDACDHYHRYPEDLDLLASVGLNAYRFSIEWARIEPEEGFFSKAETEHYRRMLGACRDRGITPLVTFHHCTSPRWLIQAGGWQSRQTVDRFGRYCAYLAKHLGDLMGCGFTINQPNLPVFQLYQDMLPPAEELHRHEFCQKAARAFDVDPKEFRTYTYANSKADIQILIDSHRRAIEAFKSECDTVPLGWTLVVDIFWAEPGGETLMEKVRSETTDVFLEVSAADDILGLQAYHPVRIGPHGFVPPPPGAALTESYGWEYYPDVLEDAVRYAAGKISTPIIVSENGIAASDDARRSEWIRLAAAGLEKCLQDGLDVRGYLYWSLLDNFEWESGYRPKFGIIGVNRETQERTVRSSAHTLGQIARRNGLDI